MPRLFRLRAVPESVIQKARFAEPPGKVPKGYFNALMEPTKLLLDRGFALASAADWLIERGSLPSQRRGQYLNTMHVRFSRFRARQMKSGSVLTWRAALGYDAAHAIGSGVVAVCGAKASRWMNATETQRKCNKCVHQLRIQTLNINREN